MSSRHRLSALLLATLCLGTAQAAHAAEPAAGNVVQAASSAANTAKGAASAAAVTKAVAREVRTAVDRVPGAPAAGPLTRLDYSRAGSASVDLGSVTLGLPAAGAPSVQSRIAVYPSSTPSSRIAVQSFKGGMRALVNISGPEAPERYEFPFGGEVASLNLEPDGRVTTLNAAGEVIGVVDAPWARDAKGAAVPTHFEVQGTTLVQVVSHRGGNFTYGITADPSFWKIAKCAASVGALFFVGAKAYKVIKSLGGVWQAARLLVGAGDWYDFAATVGHASAAALGTAAVKQNCF